MNIVQIVALALVAAILALTLKKYSPEVALIISLAASMIIFFSFMPQLTQAVQTVTTIGKRVNIESDYISIVLKIIGIAYIAELGSQICIDAGQSAIASKIEMAAKAFIIIIAAPIFLTLIDIITGIV